MTMTPQLNEPILEAEGYLTRAWRRLGEGLGPYVAQRVGDEALNVNRDVSLILRQMIVDGNWDSFFRRELGYKERSWVGELLAWRNESWAHQGSYGNQDIHRCLDTISRLLTAVGAGEQAEAVSNMHSELGRFIYGVPAPHSQLEDSRIESTSLEVSNMKSVLATLASHFAGAAALLPVPDAPAGDQESGERFPGETQLSFAGPSDRNDTTPASIGGETIGDNVDELLQLGNEYMEQHEYDHAIAQYRRVLELDPINLEALHNRGRSYYRSDVFGEAIEDYTFAIRLDPDHPVYWCDRGNAYADSGDVNRALSDYSRAIELDRDYVAAWYNRGNTYAENQAYDQAISDFGRVITLDPTHIQAWHNRGTAHVHKGDYDQAIGDYDHVIAIAPDSVVALQSRGITYILKDEFDLAVDDCNEAIRLNPDLATIWRVRGLAYAHKVAIEEAISDFVIAVSVNPDDELAQEALDSLTHLKDEIIDYDQAIENNPDDPDGWHLRGIHLIALGFYSPAVDDLQKAVQLSPDMPEAWNDLGLAYSYLEKDGEALDSYDRAIALKADFAEAYYNRSLALRRRNDQPGAQVDLAKARELGFNP